MPAACAPTGRDQPPPWKRGRTRPDESMIPAAAAHAEPMASAFELNALLARPAADHHAKLEVGATCLGRGVLYCSHLEGNAFPSVPCVYGLSAFDAQREQHTCSCPLLRATRAERRCHRQLRAIAVTRGLKVIVLQRQPLHLLPIGHGFNWKGILASLGLLVFPPASDQGKTGLDPNFALGVEGHC